jgi:hypothetical protein
MYMASLRRRVDQAAWCGRREAHDRLDKRRGRR